MGLSFRRSAVPTTGGPCDPQPGKPLLIGQGTNGPRVKRAESLQIVEALRKKNKVVEYVEYEDEGHGFARPENRLDCYAKAENFLARHLGGRQEPLEP